MTDDRLISLNAAVDELEERLRANSYSNVALVSELNKCIGYIMQLPSAQQERKKGKWIYNSPVTMKCNQCGFVIKDWDWHRFKYCPNCIADMRGESDG